MVEANDFGGAWVLDWLWRRLGIDQAIRDVASNRRVDAEKVERVLFGLVAGRAVAPSSKLEACRWITDEVHIDGLTQVDTDRCYRAMDFLLDSLDDLQTIFFSVADLLQLDVDVLFFDTTSTYFEIELGDDLHDDEDDEDDEDRFRVHGHSRTTAPTARRSWWGWRSPAAGSPSGCGSGRVTPLTSPLSRR